MLSPSARPVVFLDLDDTLCLNAPYGGMHVHQAMHAPDDAPADLYERLFAPESVLVLNALLEEFNPCIVMTTSWLALLQREHFVELFRRTGLQHAAGALHPHWDATANRGVSRAEAIDNWLTRHHKDGQPILILDDVSSGESLVDSFHASAGRAVLCAIDEGLQRRHLSAARNALRRPYVHSRPWL